VIRIKNYKYFESNRRPSLGASHPFLKLRDFYRLGLPLQYVDVVRREHLPFFKKLVLEIAASFLQYHFKLVRTGKNKFFVFSFIIPLPPNKRVI